MDSFTTLRAALQPLLGAAIEQADLLIFPTDATGDLSQTDTLLRLRTAAGSFVLGLQPDGQTPAVDTTTAFVTAGPGGSLAQRRAAWMAGLPPEALTYECFSSTGFDWLRGIVGARVRHLNILEYPTGGLTGLELGFDYLTVYSVPGAGGNRVLPALPPQYFPEVVIARAV